MRNSKSRRVEKLSGCHADEVQGKCPSDLCARVIVQENFHRPTSMNHVGDCSYPILKKGVKIRSLLLLRNCLAHLCDVSISIKPETRTSDRLCRRPPSFMLFFMPLPMVLLDQMPSFQAPLPAPNPEAKPPFVGLVPSFLDDPVPNPKGPLRFLVCCGAYQPFVQLLVRYAILGNLTVEAMSSAPQLYPVQPVKSVESFPAVSIMLPAVLEHSCSREILYGGSTIYSARESEMYCCGKAHV